MHYNVAECENSHWRKDVAFVLQLLYSKKSRRTSSHLSLSSSDTLSCLKTSKLVRPIKFFPYESRIQMQDEIQAKFSSHLETLPLENLVLI